MARQQIASLPPVLKTNPYQRLLYRELSVHGFDLAESQNFTLQWLWSARERVRFVHFHWPHPNWRHRRGPRVLHAPLSWLKLGLFALRLSVARRLGYRIVWTVHQVYPHETTSRRRDRLGALVLARASDLLLAHDSATLDVARAELGAAVRNGRVVPHGSYLGVYPPGRSRDEVRKELGIASDALVFLIFGALRAYKDVDLLLEAFRAAAIPGASLVVAGTGTGENSVARAIGPDDPRLVAHLGYVPDERVAELFGAADVAVVARGDGGTSGSLILALTMGVPVIAARRPTYQDLLGGEAAGWTFDPGDAGGLRQALERAAATSVEERRARGRAALLQAQALRWSESGARTAGLLRELVS